MGSSLSAPSEAVDQEKTVERLSALEMRGLVKQQNVEKDYVSIDVDPPPTLFDPAISKNSLRHPRPLSLFHVEQWEEQLLEDPKNRLALSALLGNPLPSIVCQKVATLPDTQTFNIKIPLEGSPVTNQRSSGRCWLFAATNVFRVAVMKKHNLKECELSQAYLFYWDKLEKANFFLEQILDTTNEEVDSRIVQELLKAPVNDGGQWDMVANLVAKYGLVPQVLYPDSYSAMNSSAMDSLLTTKLREDALKLRSLAKSTQPAAVRAVMISHAKVSMMREIFGILTLMLGPPPKPELKFAWEYYDANGKYHKVFKTPLEFAEELSSPSLTRSLSGADVGQLFSLVNDPRHEYGRLLTVNRLGNVIGGRRITYVNVDMDTMKNAGIAMLKAGLPVFFGSDVGKSSNSQTGIMDTALYDYSLAFNIQLNMTKSQRLQAHESAMTHAMVLTAVQVEDGKAIRWRVENSWGEAAGEKGFFVMTDNWMDAFVYQVVVDPSFVSKEVRDVLNSKALELPLWDPMGALA